jgi:hypothetical protein
VALGVPAEALRRRPDVRSAERQLAAQFAQVDVARADLYPTFRLAGSIGLESLSLARLFLPVGLWNASPSVNSRIFNRQQLRQNLVIQSERQEQAARTYESRVLSALQEVEDSLTALAQEQVRRDHRRRRRTRPGRRQTCRSSSTRPACAISGRCSTRSGRCCRYRTSSRQAARACRPNSCDCISHSEAAGPPHRFCLETASVRQGVTPNGENK